MGMHCQRDRVADRCPAKLVLAVFRIVWSDLVCCSADFLFERTRSWQTRRRARRMANAPGVVQRGVRRDHGREARSKVGQCQQARGGGVTEGSRRLRPRHDRALHQGNGEAPRASHQGGRGKWRREVSQRTLQTLRGSGAALHPLGRVQSMRVRFAPGREGPFGALAAIGQRRCLPHAAHPERQRTGRRCP